jgi:hypothetical protein
MTAHVALALSEVEASPILGSTGCQPKRLYLANARVRFVRERVY